MMMMIDRDLLIVWLLFSPQLSPHSIALESVGIFTYYTAMYLSHFTSNRCLLCFFFASTLSLSLSASRNFLFCFLGNGSSARRSLAR